MMAFTVLELITEALQNLIALEPPVTESAKQRKQRLMAQLKQLDDDEQRDYNYMVQTPLPIELKLLFDETLWKGDQREENKEAMKDLGIVDAMVKDFFFCHTAILPAEIRFRGLLTGNFDAVGTVMDELYEHGIMQSQIANEENPSDENKKIFAINNPNLERGQQMMLGASDDDYEYWCPEPTRNDHKDFFYISSVEGWRTLTLPNDAEKEYYREFDLENSRGWIFVCMASCKCVNEVVQKFISLPLANLLLQRTRAEGFWGECKDGDIHDSIMDGSFDAGEFGKIEMEVNGVTVTDAKCFSKCCALRHGDLDGYPSFKWPSNADGTYDIRIRITESSKYAYARFSSFILA